MDRGDGHRKNKTKTTSRRRILKAFGASSMLPAVGVVHGSDKLIDIPSGFAGDEVVYYETVPEEWWETVQHVEQLKEELHEEYAGLPEIIGVGITRSEKQIGDLFETELRVTYDRGDHNLNDVERMVPNSIEGINIQLHGVEQDIPEYCRYRDNFTPVPGGVIVRRQGDNNLGTLCARAYDLSREEHVYLTAAHVAAGRGNTGCDNNPIGDSLSQSTGSYTSNRYLGNVVSYNASQDWAAIDLSDSQVSHQRTLQHTESNTITLDNRYANYSYLMSSREMVYKLGASTGRQSGRVTAYDDTANHSCITLDGEGVEVIVSLTADGDSGGPTYVRKDGNNMLVSLHCLGRNSNGETVCNNNEARTYSVGISSTVLGNNGFAFYK
jgi:hypothetical protein